MAKPIAISSKPVNFNTFHLLLLAITLGCASSARILDEADPQPPIPADTPNDVAGPTTTSPTVLPNSAAPVAAPIATSAPDANADNTVPASVTNVAPITTPVVATSPAKPTSSSISATMAEHPSLSFFMHDILGGTHPSGRAVTGIVTNSDSNTLPFSKPNNQVIPINGGIPLNTLTSFLNNNNNNNVPFLVGLNGSPSSSSTIIQNSGNNNIVNNNNNQPFVSAGQLPAGLTLQQLMFGSITVVDNELTEGHELGSAVLGSAQGFYLSSSLDGTSHTLVLTALFHGGHYQHEIEDTISFFGIHRTASPESQLAVIGGSGKYEDAKGYATILTLPQHDQHTTDGVETITQFNVYLTA